MSSMALEQLSFKSVNGRTDDTQKVITIAHPEQSSGELKIFQRVLDLLSLTGTQTICHINHQWKARPSQSPLIWLRLSRR